MLKFALILDKIIPLIRNMLIPALLFGGGLVYFFAAEEIPHASQLTLHHLFYAASCLSFLILLYFRKGIAVFFILTGAVSYVLTNYIKITNPAAFRESADFINLSIFIPLNLIIFYFWPQKQLLKKKNIYLLLLIFAQFSIGEHLHKYNIALNYTPFSANGNLCFLSYLIFFGALFSFFWKAVNTGKIYDYALFFAAADIFLGFYYADSATALTLFYSLSSITILIATILYIYTDTYKDELTGFSSRSAFMLQYRNFPLKYSLAVAKIDNYISLKNAFRRRGLNKLMKMIALRINACETEATIYRYGEDELVIIFKNEDKNNAYNKMEQIRRSIASASFMMSNFKKPVKLTLTASVTEKKRSDATALETLARTYKALQETVKFSQNVTSKL